MKLRSPAGLAAGLVLLFATPAWAGPTVSVRVEGAGGTLLERTRVTLPDAAAPPCSRPHTAAAAIEAATGGNWDRREFTQTIMGETHKFDDSDYWAEWVDRGAGPKRGAGICNDVLAEGDEVVMLADRSPAPTFAPTVFPLDLEGLPAQVQRGAPVTLTAVDYRSATGASARATARRPPARPWRAAARSRPPGPMGARRWCSRAPGRSP
jgi:hypothetical protein